MRALCTRAPARIRLPTADVAASGRGSSQPASEAAQSADPPAKVRITAAFLQAGPRTSITTPRRTVPAQMARSTPSVSASAGATATRNGVSAQCRAHQAAAHAASRDPEARYALDGTVAREFFMMRHRRWERTESRVRTPNQYGNGFSRRCDACRRSRPPPRPSITSRARRSTPGCHRRHPLAPPNTDRCVTKPAADFYWEAPELWFVFFRHPHWQRILQRSPAGSVGGHLSIGQQTAVECCLDGLLRHLDSDED